MLNEILYWSSIVIYFIFIILLGASILFAFFTQIPFIPTKQIVCREMIRLAKLKNGQTVYDLGCGDFRLLSLAEKSTAVKTIGFEVAPIPYILGLLRKKLSKSKGRILCKNFFKQNLSDADIIFIYLIPDILPKLAKKIKTECKKGTIIISNTFQLKDLPLKHAQPKDKSKSLPAIYVYEL